MSIQIASHFSDNIYPDTDFMNTLIENYDIYSSDNQKISKVNLFNNKNILDTFIHNKKNSKKQRKKENQKILINYLNKKIKKIKQN